ncbi:MAG: proline--tRNA ligase [Candidatus Shapirobacteria bacterium]
MTKFEKNLLKKRSVDLSEWYNDVILKAELADYAPVKGCMIIRPYGYALWEAIQQFLDKLIKERGVKNAYFPIFIPESFINKEKEHVEGFAPLFAVVTIAGGKKLKEKLIIRPTSEAIMYEMYKKWTTSWRELPILVNQWGNVVRWEKRTYLFLRTSEFLWQEGHCAHLTHKESLDQVIWALNAYQKTYNNLMATYGIPGIKSESEKFAGAYKTYTLELLMPNGKALQACTSHDLGQNFSKAIGWTVQDQNKSTVHPWQNSWGFSTRSIGSLIMVHGDDSGLILPPNIAPIQIIVVPIPGQEIATKFAQKIFDQLKNKFRIEIDLVDDESAGFKFNKWELKGVPIRLEIGAKEANANEITLFRRDTCKKVKVPVSELESTIQKLLDKIQHNLFEKHKKFTRQNTPVIDSYNEFKDIMSTTRGFLSAFWCEDLKCEAKIKKETKATIRCLPLDSKKEKGKCIYCGKKSHYRWLFAQSY